MKPCRLCQNKTKSFLTLGRVPLPEEFRSPAKRFSPVITYPLGLSYCTTCHHVQLTHLVLPDSIYKKNYFYDYSVTASGRKHWKHLAESLINRHGLTSRDLVVDIGSNTGTLLSYFRASGTKILGVDPARKLTRIAQKAHIPTIVSYFTPSVARNIVKKYGQASIITCTNVFDHVSLLTDITEAFRLLLSPSGTLVIEVPYFYRMLLHHTHIPYLQQTDYLMLSPLIPFFKRFELDIVDAEEIPLHGGSVRISITHTGKRKPSRRLSQFITRERIVYKTYPTRLAALARAVKTERNALIRLVGRLKRQGKRVGAVGASAKGMTLLHYCGLGFKDIDFITEKSELKIGRFTPGGIPIEPDTTLLHAQPDYAVLLSWNFAKEIMTSLKGYKGTWIIPIPKLNVLA